MVPVNYWAILVCGVASMVLGSIWYGPLFGKTWQQLMGWGSVSEEQKKAMMAKMNQSYILAFLGALAMAYILSHSLTFAQAYLKSEGTSAAFQTAFWNWLGFIAPVTLSTISWEGKSWKLWFLNNAYWLILLFIMGLILVNWK